MNTVSRVVSACVLLFLTACNSLPVYTPAPGDKTVEVRFVGYGRPSICFDGKGYNLDLKKDKDQQLAQVPADKRVMVFTYLSYAGYQVTSSCKAALSLTPRAGKPFIVNSGTTGGRCFVEAVLEDNSTATGVALDPSVGPPRC